MKLSSSSSLIQMMLKYLLRSKEDPHSLLVDTGINPNILEDSNARIPANQVYALWKRAEAQTHDPNFGLHMGESMQKNPGGNLLFSVMMNSPSIYDALDKFCRYHCIMNDAIQPILEVRANEASLSWKMNSSWPDSSRHISELMLCIFQSILNHLTDSKHKPTEVRFRHARPMDTSVHQNIFPSILLFDQKKDELIFDKHVLEENIFLSDQRLLETIEHHASDLTNRIRSQDSWANRVLLSIDKHMQGNKPVINLIARDLAVSTRYLQNKLCEENTSFQKLLDKARKKKALHYLKNQDIPLVDIAFILGFSEQSTFNHTFKRLTGKTPAQYRQAK